MSTTIPPKNKTSAETEAEACRLYVGEMPISAIAKKLDIGRATVWAILRRNEVEPRSAGNPGNPKKDVAFINAWNDAGPAEREKVARRFGYKDARSAGVAAHAIRRGERNPRTNAQTVGLKMDRI